MTTSRKYGNETNNGQEDDDLLQSVAGICRRLLVCSFYSFSVTLLALVLPLSFLLFVRISASPQILDFFAASNHLCFSIFLRTVFLIPQILVPPICICAFLHSLLGYNPRFGISMTWAVLGILQLCIGLGIEATVVVARTAQVESSTLATSTMPSVQRVVFFIGVYETMLFWLRAFVRPVANDTIFGASVEETEGERLVTGVTFGVVWLVMLRDEVESLMGAKGGWYGVFCWMIGALMVVIGITRVMRWLVWLGKAMVNQKDEDGEVFGRSYSFETDHKVRGTANSLITSYFFSRDDVA